MGCNPSKDGNSNHGAHEPEKKKKHDKDDEEITMEMKLTHIHDMDAVFSKAASPLQRLCAMKNALHQARKAIHQLAKLKDIDDFVEKCVKDIKGEMKASNFELYINVESAGYVYVYVRPDLVPEHLKKMYQAVVDLADAIKTVITEAPQLKPDLEAIAEEAKNLPDRVTDAARQAGLSPLKIPGAIKATADNVKELSRAPELLEQTVQEAKKLVHQLQKAFE